MKRIGEFKYGVNAIRALISATGKTPAEIINMKEALAYDMEVGASIIWAGMVWNNKNLTIDEVGDLLDSGEGLYVEALKEAFGSLVTAFNRLFIPPAEPKKAGAIKN